MNGFAQSSAGGRIVAAGTPEEVAAVEASHTGRLLRGRVEGSGTEGNSLKKGRKGGGKGRRPLP